MDSFQLGEDFTECIKLGILHSPTGRFLTAEVFNNEINVSGTALRRRQVWTIITERGRPDTVYIQSHLGRFLSADKDGKVNAASKIPGVDERFLLEYSPQATGEWSFRSEAHSYYLSGSETQISCFSKSPVWWAVRLAVHPQINLRNQFRSRYLRLLPDSSELRADQPHPWGSETLIWLEQVSMNSGPTAGRGGGANVGRAAVARFGRVALRSENGQYLKPDGSLADEMEDSVLFAFELRPGHPRTFAFRDSNGAYLTTIGPGTVKVKTNVTTPGKEELFLIERAALQVGILAHNNKYASVKQGVEISANQHELDDTAIFQLEYIGGKGFNSNDAIASSNSAPHSPSGDPAPLSAGSSATNGMTPGIFCLVTGYWRLRARSGKLWLMAPSAGVQSTASDGDKCSLFEILTLSDDAGRGHVVLKANTPGSGQSLSARKLGAISSSGRTVCEVQSPAETDLFRVILVNRPSIALVSLLTGGFVSRGKQTTLDCSSVTYERFLLQLTKNNTYQLFAKDTKSSFSLWTVSPSGLIHLKPTNRRPDDDPLDPECLEPGTEFLFHFLGCGRTLIRVVGEVNGGFTLVKAEPKGEVKWDSANEILANYIWEI
ncbi:Fascin [Clonorchis sinensis]|uniref:Fascin n=2 Tax=Clonorchis sinensis TaxID=79923 RepID=G7YM25_CLOSI|nr:Fascin [Clonorchis sinensis]GAA54006.1 fascin [Clonorchis sinensis]